MLTLARGTAGGTGPRGTRAPHTAQPRVPVQAAVPGASRGGNGDEQTTQVLESWSVLCPFLTCRVPARGPRPNPRTSGTQEREKSLRPLAPGLHVPPHGGLWHHVEPGELVGGGQGMSPSPKEAPEARGSSDTDTSRPSLSSAGSSRQLSCPFPRCTPNSSRRAGHCPLPGSCGLRTPAPHLTDRPAATGQSHLSSQAFLLRGSAPLSPADRQARGGGRQRQGATGCPSQDVSPPPQIRPPSGAVIFNSFHLTAQTD